MALIVCYWQLRRLWSTGFEWTGDIHWLALSTMILLMPLNYFFEWKKWRATIDTLHTDFGIQTNFQAFLAGIVTAMVTPNMQGNFLGRMYYYPRRFRPRIVALTLITNLSQFIVTIGFGVTALAIMDAPDRFGSNYLLINFMWVFAFLLICYFTFEKWPSPVYDLKLFKRLRDLLTVERTFRAEVLFWGILRHIVFSTQFLLSLMAFGVQPNWELYVLIWQLYLLTSLSPSLFLGKLFIRESIALWVFSGWISNEWVIILASLSIWLTNLLIPSLFGLIICRHRTPTYSVQQ